MENVIKDNQPFDIYLASRSPRRQELLRQIGVDFTQLEMDIPEIPNKNEPAEIFVQRMALAKARAGCKHLKQNDPHPVLGADTAVVVDGAILGKPVDKSDALSMLLKLSGREHLVCSAVALMTQDQKAVRLNQSRVSFRALSEAEIEAYWQSGECQDKAGAYGIQGKAAMFIDNLSGSYSGVMGLPIFETCEILKLFGIIPLQ